MKEGARWDGSGVEWGDFGWRGFEWCLGRWYELSYSFDFGKKDGGLSCPWSCYPRGFVTTLVMMVLFGFGVDFASASVLEAFAPFFPSSLLW